MKDVLNKTFFRFSFGFLAIIAISFVAVSVLTETEKNTTPMTSANSSPVSHEVQ